MNNSSLPSGVSGTTAPSIFGSAILNEQQRPPCLSAHKVVHKRFSGPRPAWEFWEFQAWREIFGQNIWRGACQYIARHLWGPCYFVSSTHSGGQLWVCHEGFSYKCFHFPIYNRFTPKKEVSGSSGIAWGLSFEYLFILWFQNSCIRQLFSCIYLQLFRCIMQLVEVWTTSCGAWAPEQVGFRSWGTQA